MESRRAGRGRGTELNAAIDLSHLPRAARESEPTLTKFCPFSYQRDVLKLIRKTFDYSTGTLEILLSGSYGSAKSVLLAHLAVTHAMMFKRSRVAIVRRALPDIKATIFKEILEHIEADLIEGVDYWKIETRGIIKFRNGSEIVSAYWADRRYKRMRSLKLSMVIIEEGTENDEQDKEGFDSIKARLRRLPHVKENVLIVATNPDSPAHWIYEYFIVPNSGDTPHETRRVFYSRTEENPYLDPMYVKQLRKDLDPRAVKRYLDGEWIELTKDRVYYAYSQTENFRKGKFTPWPGVPIRLAWDFNIGVGKPLSMTCFQVIDDTFHFFHEVVVEGMRTEESLDALASDGILDMATPYFIVNGDASGRHRDTRNIRDDYEIIMKYLQNYRTASGRPIHVRKLVPLKNAPIRERHNKVNAYCLNDLGERRLFVYEPCKTLAKGLRLVQLRKGADYIEDDGPNCPYQHVTTALGYGVLAALMYDDRGEQTTREL